MKKFTKFALGCAVTCAAVGLGLSVAGLAMGAASTGKDVLAKALDETIHSDNMRWSVSVLRDEEDWDDMDEEWNNSVTPKETNGSSIFEFDEYKNLDIELSADELYLKKYDGKGIQVEVSENDDKVRVKQDGDTLKIKSLTKLDGTQITVYYPADLAFNEVDIEVDAGTIHMEDDWNVNDLEIQVGAGEMTSDGKIIAREISVDVGTGEVDMNSVESHSIDVECGVGSLKLKLFGAETEYNYQVECGLGRVTVGNQTYSGISEEAKVKNAGATKKLEVECGMGDVEILFTE